MSGFPHDCDQMAWPGWGACTSCGAPRVCCTECSDDLTDHHPGCDATPY